MCGLVSGFFYLLTLAIVARALLSWFSVDPYNPAVRFLNRVTDVILEPLRRVIPLVGMMDITPIVAILLIQFVIEPVAVQILISLGLC